MTSTAEKAALDHLVRALSHSWDSNNARVHDVLCHAFEGNRRPLPEWTPREQALFEALLFAIDVNNGKVVL